MPLNDKSKQKLQLYNVTVVIITIACIGAIIESLVRGWEIWAIPLLAGGVIACWWIHINHYKEDRFRENFYLIFFMLVAFFHGMHESSYFDVTVLSMLLLVIATLLNRKEYLTLILIEYFAVMITQTIWAGQNGGSGITPELISKLILHVITELCIYKALGTILKNNSNIEAELDRMHMNEEAGRIGMEDFLVNISHELRTPVNVINGMSTLILKKENREDVTSIRDAGLRLSYQIEDIQDYSEIQRGGAFLEEEKYMITSLLNDIASNFSMMSERKDLDFIIDLDPNVPNVMKGDVRKVNKIMLHLLDNAFKYTKKGGVYLKISGSPRGHGVNLNIEVTDTGVGMTELDIERVSKGSYQADRKRNRSTGGIGLGLSIVYGFTRLMNGFVSIESALKRGTTVRISLVQEIVDPKPCLSIGSKEFISIAFHIFPEKYKFARIREFYKSMISNLATGLRLNIYSAVNLKELKKLLEKREITHVFMGAEEYRKAPDFFDKLTQGAVKLAIYADNGFTINEGTHITVIPKPLYGYTVTRQLNGIADVSDIPADESDKKPSLEGLKALIVDDEPMNLVVAAGLLKEYGMDIDTAESGQEAIKKYGAGDYNIVFMDHMMPEMDGVEAMKRLRALADQDGRQVKIVALTANAISGAREMFLREGFDGFISKPVNINDFERVMNRVMSAGKTSMAAVSDDNKELLPN